MKFTLFLVSILFFLNSLSAQSIRGKIVDNNGTSIPNTALFIKEIALGITADENGEFQTSLKKGNYTFEFSSLGYERKAIPLIIDQTSQSIIVVLDKKTYSIKEVVVSASKEDPAYSIMRKAISMAPYYLNQIKKYESKVYMKGSIKIEKIPSLLQTGSGQSLKNFTNKLFVLESQNEVQFTSPNKYDQKVVAFSTTLPLDMDAEKIMSVTTSNIYDPKAFNNISPLAPNAFTYYKFRFDGVSIEGNNLVNKIRVLPKKKNGKLFSGWLYIVENSWNIQSVDLKTTEFGATMHFTTAYNEIKSGAYLPTSYDINYKIDMMGIKAAGKYYSSIQYQSVELNDSQNIIRKDKHNDISIVTNEKPKTEKEKKIQKRIEKLRTKEKLSNKETYQLAKLITQATETKDSSKVRESLEIKPANSFVKISVDTLAKSRDSIYWAQIRNLPLKPEEAESYKEFENMPSNQKSNKGGENSIVINPTKGGIASKLLLGDIKKIGEKYKFGYKGLLGIIPEYNFSDGFWIGEKVIFGSDFSKTKSLYISPSVYFLTARKTFNWQMDITFNYSPMKNGELYFSMGKTSSDYNSKNGTLRLLNSISSLFFASNPIKFYKKEFFELNNRVDLINGLQLSTGIQLENRNTLDNNCSFSFFGKNPKTNIPYEGYERIHNDKILKPNVKLSYTPRYYYRVYQGRKKYEYSHYPTFSVEFEKGISNVNSSYNMLEVGIKQNIKINDFQNINYSVSAGSFFSNDNVLFSDYKHFNTNDILVTGSSFNNNFNLLNNYTYSTSKRWIEGHLNYTSDYLLLKQIPFLQSFLFNESLHTHTLWIPRKNYIELGYTAGLNEVARIGIFVGFEDREYNGIGISISLPILKTFGIK